MTNQNKLIVSYKNHLNGLSLYNIHCKKLHADQIMILARPGYAAGITDITTDLFRNCMISAN